MTGHGGGFVLELARVLDAPIVRVFGLLTQPAELARWWGPRGFTTPQVDVELRAGGRLRFTMQPPEGQAFHISGEYLHVRVPAVLEFTFRYEEPGPDDRETVVALALAPLGDRTAVTLNHGEFATQERLDLHRRGWADSFDRLDAVLAAG